MTRAASWSTAPDGSVRSSEFTDVIETLEDRSLLSAGDLDTTFGGGDGIVTTTFGANSDSAYDVVIQADGKMVVAGLSGTGGSVDFAVARYNVDGSLDPTFGNLGKVVTDLGAYEAGVAAAIDGNGKIVVVGQRINGINSDFAVVRYNTNGSLDTSFDGDGFVITDFGSNSDFANSVAIDANGKIVVGGEGAINNSVSRDFVLARYNTDGSLDNSFDTDGKQTVDFSGREDFGNDLVIDGDGKIVVAGRSDSLVAVARITTTGALDTTFSTDGLQLTDPGSGSGQGHSVVIDANGKLVVGGNAFFTDLDFVVLRYNADGSLDTSFDTDGIAITDFGSGNDAAFDLALDANGRIVAAGFANVGGNRDFGLARYNANGTLDTSFSSDGKVTTAIGSFIDVAFAVAIDSQGRIVAAGATDATGGNVNDFAVLRYDGGQTLSISDASVTEGDSGTSILTFNVTLTGDTSSGFTVAYSTQDGTATTTDNDYDAIPSGSLNFTGTSGETHTIQVTVNSDTNFEVDETLSVLLGTITGNSQVTIADGTGVGTILNDEASNNGGLDPNFGTGGIVTSNTIGPANGVAIQSDNKVIVVGGVSNGPNNFDFYVQRYNTDGTLDTTFGTNGTTLTHQLSADIANGVAIQPDGKIVVVGYTAGGTAMMVVRYNTNGTLDATFGTSGIKVISGTSEARDVTIQSDGKIVVVGADPGGLPGRNTAVVRLNSDGSLDTTFNTTGLSIQNTAFDDFAEDVAQQADGKLVVAVNGSGSFGVLRYNTNGTLDSSFGSGGFVQTIFGFSPNAPRSVLIQSDGKILVSGTLSNGSNFDFGVVRYNTNGSLDTSFGTGGMILTPFGSNQDEGFGMSLQPDGKIIVGGSAIFNLTSADFALARYNTDGTLDTSFGTNGKVTTDLPSFGSDVIHDIALQSDGGIVAVGIRGNNLAIARYGTSLAPSSDGSLDTTFDTDGIQTTNLGGNVEIGYDVVIQADGKMVVAGFTNPSTFDFAVARYNVDGSPNGTVVTNLGGDEQALAAAIDSNGNIVVVGYQQIVSNRNFAVVRYTPGLTLDSSFGSGGIVISDFGGTNEVAQGVAIDANGKIVVIGWGGITTHDFTVARYNTDGSLDTSFDTDGHLTADFGGGEDFAYDVAIASDGKIVVVGESRAGADGKFSVARFTTSGALDTTFDTDGWQMTDFGSSNDIAYGVAIDANGKLVVGGTAILANSDFGLVRYNTNGSLDTSFDTDGIVTTDFGSSSDGLQGLVLDSNGRIVAVGSSNVGGTTGFAVARYNSNGTLDPSFSSDGKVTTLIGSLSAAAVAAAIDSQGRIVAAGYTEVSSGSYDFAVVRYGTGTVSSSSVSVDLGATTSVAEGSASQLTYTLTRVGDTSGALTVNVTFGGGASLGSDYSQSGASNVSGNNAQVTFLAGSATATVTITSLDDLTDENTESVTLTVASGSGYTVGAPASDSGDITDNDDPTSANFTIPDDGTVRVVMDGTTLEIRSVPGDVVLASRDIGTLTGGVTFDSGSQDETLIVDASNGNPIPTGGLNFDADGGTDRLVLIGDGTQNPDYQPNSTTNGTGLVDLTGGTINFTGLDAADFDTVGTFTLVTPNANDTVDLANGMLGSGADATSITGTSGGVGFPQANVRNSGIAIDTTSVAGTDTVTVTSASNNHGNTSLNVIAGTEAGDIININGTTTFSGTTTLNAKTINLNANVTNAVTGTTATSVNVTAPGQIQDGINVAADGGTVHIAAGNYAGIVDTSAKSVTLDPAGTVNSNGTWSLDNNDTLNIAINGTTPGTQYDQINVTSSIALGGAILNVTGTYTPTTADTFEIIKANGSVTGSLDASTYLLNGKPLTPAIDATAPGNVVLGFDSTPDLSGTGGNDDFVISRDNFGNVVVTRNGTPILTVPEGDLTSLDINPGDGDDTLVVDVSNGDPIPAGGLNFNGGIGNDRLVIIGDGTQNPNYSPDGADDGDGSVTLNEGTINFSDTENADFDNVGTFTLDTPNADDVVNLANGSLGSGADATSISGTSGGVGFTPANVRNSDIVIDTTSVAGTDTVTVTSASNNHGNTSLNVIAGTEAGDIININGTTTFSGTTTLDAKTINLNANVTNAVTGSTATTVNVVPGAQIQDGIDVAAATGGTVNIASGTYTGDVNTSGKSVTLDLEPSVAVINSTGNWTLDANDALNFVINGTTAGTQYEQLNVTGDIELGGARLNLFGTHVPAPADTFSIINATGTLSGVLSPSTHFLNGKPLEATYTASPGNVTLGYDATPSIDGGAGADEFEVSLDGSGNIVVTNHGVPVMTIPFAGLTELTINGTDDDDSLLIDYTNGNPIPDGGLTFNGGDGDDSLAVKGTGGQIVVYTPDALLNGKGVIDIDGKIVNFTGLEPVDFDSVLSFTLNLPNGDDLVSITNGFNSAVTTLLEPVGTVPAIVFSGTSGGIGFEAAHVFRTTNVTVDTTLNTDGNDTITINSADNAHGNTNLTINTGTGTDAVNFVGAVNFPNMVTIITDGAVTDNAPDGVTDITALTLAVSAASIGVSGNDLDLSVDSLTTNTSAVNGDQFLNEANGLTQVNLAAGSGDITLIAGAITDADVATDFAADALTVTATSFGASLNNIDTSVNSLSVDTSASNGDQFIHESTGLTDLNLNAGSGDITLVDEGQISDTSADGVDVAADEFSLTITTAGEFGSGGNRIETDVTSLSATTLGQDRNVYIHEANSLTNTNITLSPADIHLSAGGDINTGTGILTGNGLNLVAGGSIDVDTTVSQLNLSTLANGNITVNETNNLGQLNIDAGSGDVSITAGGTITDGDGALDIAADEISLIATSLGAAGLPLQLNANTLTTDTDDLTDGDQYLSEANSLTVGAADLNAGSATLYLVSGAFLTASGGDIVSNVVVESGATLGGSGSVTGTTQVNAGGTVAPGATTGILNTIDVVFASGSNFNVEVDGNVAGTSYDQLNVTGTVDLGGTTLVTSGLVTSTPGQQIVLINNDGTDAIVGTFNGLAEGATVTINGVDFFLSYVGGSNANDVTLTETGPADYTSDGVGAGALELRLNAGNVQFVDDGVVVDSRPLAAVLNQLITIDGSDPANETLLVNFAFGGFFDVDVLFNGGIGPGGNDKLVVDGGTFTTAEHTFTTVLPAEHSGNIEYDTGAAVVTISYTGLEPVDMTGSTITDLIFNLPVGSANDFRLEDDGNLANGLNRIVSNGGTFETTLFVNPTGSLTINAGGLGDYFNLYQLDDGYYTLGAPITFNGGAGADRMYVNTNASTTTIPTGDVNFVGSGNNDGFSILPGYVATTIAHSFTNSNDGSVNIDGRTINYDDMNIAVGIYDQLTATNRTFQFAAGSDTISFGDDPTANDNFSRISGSGSVTTDFKNPSVTFALNGGDGNDAITIGSFAGMDAQFVAAVTIDGEGDTDSITQNAAMTLGSGTSTGNLSLTAETIDLNATISTTAGTVGTVTLSGTDISINAAINAGGNVSATATNNIDLTGGSITTSGDANVSAGNALTTDAAGTDITATNASLGSGAGGIGTLANPIRLSVTTLVTDSNGLSDGDQFLVEADTLDIGAADLDAGTATITLVSGTFLTTATGSILSNTVVANGATLGGNGSVTGSVTAQSGGTVSPGPTTAVLNTGSLSMTAGANFNAQVNGNVAGTSYDQLNVTGTVNLGGATLNATGTIPSLTNQVIVLINNNDVDPVVGTFVGLPEGETVFINGLGFKISYVGGTGNDVTLTELIQVTVTVSPASVGEDSNQPVYYTFHRNDILDVMTVNFGISGAAVVIDDFTNPSGHIRPGAVTGTFAFGYGQSDYVIMVIPNADTIVESDEALTLTLLPGSNYVPGIPNFATATIVNDDSVQQVSVAVSPTSVTEDGSGNLIYTFTRTGGSAIQQAAPLTVKFNVTGAATFGTDYTQFGATTFGSTGTVTFGHGISTATVTVDPTPDSEFEPAEDVVLTLAADPSYGIGAPSSASGTITNDDLPLPEVSVSVSPDMLEDGTTNLVYTFTRTGNLNVPLTANFAVAGTATFITDYMQSGATTFSGGTGTVSFGHGQATNTIVVNPQADTIVEPDESVILTVTGGTGYTVGASNQATGQILNDDVLPTVQIAVSPSSVAEDGSTNMKYTFTRTGNLNVPLLVNFTVGGTATLGTDYTTSGARTFNATSGFVKFGHGVSTAVVTINPSSDTLIESNEDVILTLAPSATYGIVGSGFATGTITEDDATQTVSVAVSPSGVQEDGSPNLVYTFTRTGGSTLQLNRPLAVNFTVGGGVNEATFITDYTQSGARTFSSTTGTVKFGHGVSTAKIFINPRADLIVENDEVVTLQIDPNSQYLIGTGLASGTILNDDFVPTVQVTVSPLSVSENNPQGLIYTFSRSNSSLNPLTVNFLVGGGANEATFGTDYMSSGANTFSGSAGTVTFGHGQSTVVVVIQGLSDLVAEPDEEVTIKVVSGTGYDVGAIDTAIGTLLDALP